MRYEPLKTNIIFNGLIDGRLSFTVFINDKKFDYWQGIGHILTSKELRQLRSNGDKREARKVNLSTKEERAIRKTLKGMDYFTVINPKIEDVLYCLFSDAQCGSYSFNDFCDNLGYSNDSIKAFETYRKCEETLRDIRLMGFNVDAELEYLQEQGY